MMIAPVGRRVEARDQSEQRGLAAARRAGDRHDSRRDDKIERVKDRQRATPLVTVFETPRSSIMSRTSCRTRLSMVHTVSATIAAPCGFG